MFICFRRLCPLLPLGVVPVVRRAALLGPFLRAFSINYLFLFSEFVSWKIIDCGEHPTAPRASSGYYNKEGRLWSRDRTLMLLSLEPLTFPLGEREGKVGRRR